MIVFDKISLINKPDETSKRVHPIITKQYFAKNSLDNSAYEFIFLRGVNKAEQ